MAGRPLVPAAKPPGGRVGMEIAAREQIAGQIFPPPVCPNAMLERRPLKGKMTSTLQH